MILGISGSRGITNYKIFKQILDEIVLFLEVTEFVSGGAIGVDKMAERYSEESNGKIKMTVILPDKPTSYYYKKRDRQIVDYCDGLIGIWDGKSPGTKYTTNYAKEKNKLINVVII